MITGYRYVIAVPDVARSAAFYAGALAFEIEPIDDPGWLLYRRDGCVILAGECPDAPPPDTLGDHSYFAYLEVTDVDAEHRRCVDFGAEIIKPLTAEPWGMREFGVRTVDGHRVMLAAVTR